MKSLTPTFRFHPGEGANSIECNLLHAPIDLEFHLKRSVVVRYLFWKANPSAKSSKPRGSPHSSTSPAQTSGGWSSLHFQVTSRRRGARCGTHNHHHHQQRVSIPLRGGVQKVNLSSDRERSRTRATQLIRQL